MLYVDNTSAAITHGGVDNRGGAAQGSKNTDMAIYRMKGVLHIAEEDHLHVLQAVHDTFDIKPSSFKRGAGEDKTDGESKIIVIGRNLGRQFLVFRNQGLFRHKLREYKHYLFTFIAQSVRIDKFWRLRPL